MHKVTEKSGLLAMAHLFIAIEGITAAVYAVQHTNSGIPALVAGQAVPAGINIIKKQALRLWPGLSVHRETT